MAEGEKAAEDADALAPGEAEELEKVNQESRFLKKC